MIAQIIKFKNKLKVKNYKYLTRERFFYTHLTANILYHIYYRRSSNGSVSRMLGSRPEGPKFETHPSKTLSLYTDGNWYM